MKKHLLVLGLYLLLSVIVTWLLVTKLNSLILDPYDGLLITWILNWDIHALSTNFLNLLNANIFFPYHNTLAFSDFQLPQAILAAPFIFLSGEPLVGYNVTQILGLALTAFAVYLLAGSLTKDGKTAVFGGIFFSFSTIHLNYLTHLQLLHFWPVVLATLCLLQRRYFWFIVFFLLATLTTPLFFYFLLTIGIIRKKFFVLFVACLVAVPTLVPYYLVSWQWHYVRPINDAIHFSLQFPNLVNISSLSVLSRLIPPVGSGTPAYLGGVFLVLTIVAFKNLKAQPFMKFFLILAGVSFVLALGPALHISQNTVHVGPIPAIPLPYLIFYYLVPGFAGMRTPSRWIILTAFALAMVIVIYLRNRVNSRLLILLGLLVLLEVNWPLKFQAVPSVAEFPPEQRWLKDNFAGAPIIQFPIYGWFDPQFGQETRREYYSTIHWHPMFNGFSGFSPAEWEQRVKWLQASFPSPESVKFLREQGIRLVLTPSDWPISLKLVKSFEKTNIYEL
jgi:hypothetical protein